MRDRFIATPLAIVADPQLFHRSFPRLDDLGEVGGHDKAFVLAGWRRDGAEMHMFGGNVIQMNVRLFGGVNRRRMYQRRSRAGKSRPHELPGYLEQNPLDLDVQDSWVPSPRLLGHVTRIDGLFASGGRLGTRNTLIGIEFDAMSILSPEQRRQIEQEGVMPIDDGAFVVVRADLYDRIRSLIDGEDLTIDEQRRLLSELGKSVGWDDPAMDVYNDL